MEKKGRGQPVQWWTFSHHLIHTMSIIVATEATRNDAACGKVPRQTRQGRSCRKKEEKDA